MIMYDRLEDDAHCICYERKTETRSKVSCQVVNGTSETILGSKVRLSGG